MEPISPSEFEEIVRQMTKGSYPQRDVAFAQIYLRYQGLVYRIARGMGHSEADAEDLVQNVFTPIVTGARPDKNTDQDWRRWISRIAHNQAVNCCRGSSRRMRWEKEAAASHPESQIDDPHAALESRENHEVKVMLAALATLEERYRSAITLTSLEGLTYEDAAEILNLPVGTVKTHARNGKAALRDLLERVPLSG